jgi:hypothetical protein
MEHQGKKLNSFSVMPTKSGRNIVIELRDLEQCGRPSVKKDIHSAVEKCLKRIINREKEIDHAVCKQTKTI